MRKIFAIVALAALIFSCSENPTPEPNPDLNPTPEPEYVSEKGHNTEPYFSETVELMGLIFRLAGAKEYNGNEGCHISSITDRIDEYFYPVRNHQAITLASQYRATSFGYDAISGYSCQLIFDEEGKIIFDPNYKKASNSSFERWSPQQKIDMLKAINDFYVASNFHQWFESTKTEQQQAIASFKAACNLDYSWFDSFYGTKDKLASRIILSFMIGLHNHGISLTRKDGTFLLTPVIGSFSQYDGEVRFGGSTNLLVHEFSHPYCNPLIDNNWAAISNKATDVFNRVKLQMQSQAYGSPQTMMYETLVRSCAIHYMKTHNQNNMATSRIAYEEQQGFMMVRSIVRALEKFEQERDKYTSLTDFMPEIIQTINSFDPDAPIVAEPDTLPKDYVDLGIEMGDGKKLYFATRNVGETSPAGIDSNVYRWGATIEGGVEWRPESGGTWPVGTTLDAEHDIATITWGEKWHTPSVEEWTLLAEKCDYERKEADESVYGVAGYFFYNKADHSKFIFLPTSTWTGELAYWSSEIVHSGNEYSYAANFRSGDGIVGCFGVSGIENTFFAIRPVFVE